MGLQLMTLRIEKDSDGSRTVLRVSGRIGSENLEELKAEIDGNKAGTTLDLEHVTLVDVEGVRFLNQCQQTGIELIHCSLYIREWMAREGKS
jgi:anti-anti-sigma regulatory factor